MFVLNSFYSISALVFMIILSLDKEAYGQKLQYSEIDSLRILLRSSADKHNKVLLLNEIARRYVHIRSYDSATTITTRAKVMAERDGNMFGLLKSYENFVHMYREKGEMEKAVEHLKIMLQLARKINVPLSEAEAYDQLGHIYTTKEDQKAALLNHEMALDIRRRKADPYGVANSADNIAHLYYHQDDYLRALDYWDEAYYAYKKTDNYWGMARTSANLGLIHYEFSNFSKAISLFYEARELYKRIQNKDGMIWTSNLIGHVYTEINNIDKAKDIYTNSLNAYIREGNQSGVAQSYTNLGNVARKKRDFEVAKQYCEQAIKIYAAVDSSGLSFFTPYKQLAEIDYELGDKKAALAKFLSMVDKPMVTQNISNRITVTNWIGRIYGDLTQYNLASKWIESAILLNARTADKSAYLISYKALAKIDSALGNFRDAYLNTQKYYMYRDSIEKQNAEKIVLKYEYENQIAKTIETSRNRQLQRNVAWALAVSALLFALVSWRYLSARSKHKIALEKVKKKAAINNQEMKSRFLANISHEFRTPLTLINGHIELLMADEKSTADKSRYAEISKNGAHLLELVDQLLELSKMDDGYYSLHYERGEVVQLIRMEVTSFESEADRCGVKLKSLFSKPAGEYAGQQFVYSRQAVTAIMYNLLSNALKHTPRTGEIEVGLDFECQLLHIWVANTGSGIADEYLSKIFDRFYQLPGEASFKGFGIGLSLVKELANYHGGRVEVESQTDGKTIFHVWLAEGSTSVEEKKEVMPAFSELSRISTTQEPAMQRNLNDVASTMDQPVVLLVDDHEEIRTFIKESLGDSYHFLEAADGEVALRMANAVLPDIIISDIRMPRMDGLDFCKAVKESAATSHIPVLLLTAIKDQSKKEDGLYLGADDYIFKPFSVAELRLRVHNRLAFKERLRIYYTSLLIKDSDKDVLLEDEEKSISKQDKDFIEKLVAAIHENQESKQVNVEFLANVACLSSSQITRKLKALINKTPAEFIRTIKMNYAKGLLESGTRVADVAWAIGYDDPANFAKVFKKQFGYSPSQQQVKGVDIERY
ncbi:Signal transduction histidine kinase [Sphingobacterium nematocida]|uniref:histidine kinase n=1 Tax=Sphingobacterium nematocida TaxID=1513896 RepID=A0A1T5EKB6_9SPHI|nr:tetratricopeptide repeat protein [Sphingobacterium nematocida]SKB84178.1 Signal transduction histidine kinase [Sphingobacterium nematocida]